EAGALLHRGELDERLRVLGHYLLYQDEAPELVSKPVVKSEGPRHAGPLEGIQADVGEDWPIDLNRRTEPTAGLVDEPVFVVIDAHRSQRGLREVENFLAFRWSLSGDEIELVVTVQMNLIGWAAGLITLPRLRGAKFLALLQFLRYVGVSCRGQESREPVQTGHDSVLDFAGGELGPPAGGPPNPETASPDRTFAAC